MPAALVHEIQDRTNLVYFEWENTGPEVATWLYLGQALRAACGRGAVTVEGASVAHISVDGDRVNGVQLHADTNAFAFSNQGVRLYVGNDGGVWSSESALTKSVSWTMLNTTLAITQMNSISLHPTDPSIAMIGTQDNGEQRYSGGQAWEKVACGDGGGSAYTSSRPLGAASFG